MRQFIPDAPLRQATPQHHREQKPHHAQCREVLQATLLLLPLRTVLHTREQQLAGIHLLYHAQTYPLAHLVSLLEVAYSIHIGVILSALLHGFTLSVVCQKGYPFVCSCSPFLLFEMYWPLSLPTWKWPSRLWTGWKPVPSKSITNGNDRLSEGSTKRTWP